ncbi:MULTISPECIES: alpha/beta hydrolase [Roseivirga]|jgi:predicted esterase|uniref:Esterase n=1 Tax=Roseivirga thermotolerans TaxID=1758176 RepID=A0ABQ3I6T8_9BACT|nr:MULTISPECIES: alpha/beta hydrolase [Roseivirga]MEC7753971.1 alpha/beta hydrolase [Bacteroidota bacterium]GHE61563.1 esterase [Roseivirga thermotolerans]|tara:strand:- start:3067 stop:3720 length:654 start_codon:yes stop_codon:yes gene_type:complete
MEKRIGFEFNARYELLGTAGPQTDEVWLVCHGHGQLARYFIRKFSSIANEKRLIVAPEGLFRYYLQGYSGRVGATWMTREDRVSDITNYISYLSAVYREVIMPLNKPLKITFLGFSQGAATISRLATMTSLPFDRLVLWAGIFPPDLPPIESSDRLRNKECLLVYGLADEFLSDERMAEQNGIARQLRVTPEVITFDGRHEINEEVVQQIAARPYRQ